MTEIINELSSVIQVDAYFGGLATMYGQLFVADESQFHAIADNLLEAMDRKGSGVKAVMDFVHLFEGLAESALTATGFGEAAAGVQFLFTVVSTAVAAATTQPDIYTTWADAETHIADQKEEKQTQLNITEPTYVMLDLGLLKTVGDLQESTIWATSTEMQQDFWNLGRQHNALWVYQTLVPSLWWIGFRDNDLTCAPDDPWINVYAASHCYWSEVLHGVVGSDPGDILEAIFDDPDPKQNCDSNWRYGKCNLAIKDDDPAACKKVVANGGPVSHTCRRAAFFWNLKDIGGTGIQSDWGMSIHNCNLACFGASEVDIGVWSGFEAPREGPLLDLNLTDTVPVTIFSSGEFNALTVDPTSIRFAGAPSVGWTIGRDDWHQYLARDVNGDGLQDVVIHFQLGELDLNHGDTIAWLTGVTTDDTSTREIRGAANVQVHGRR